MNVRRIKQIVTLAVLGSAGSLAGGCYERVVGASGMGASGVTVEESYQADYRMDNLLMGKDSSPPRLNSQPRPNPNRGTSQNEP